MSEPVIIPVYLFPDFVTLARLREGSPLLVGAIEREGVELREVRWDGNISSLPGPPSCIVHCSGALAGEKGAITAACTREGHIAVCMDVVLTDRDNSHNPERAAEEWLASHYPHVLTQPA